MYTPAAKRRRIEAASSTLSKPFRSPFKSPSKVQSPSKNTETSTSNISETFPPILSEKTPNLTLSPAATPHRTHSEQKKLSPSVPISSQLNNDPEIAQLLRAQRELEKRLREVKEQLETAEQAKKIETESRKTNAGGELDGELVVLTERWKGASRQAAEELFGKVRDRVNRIGGPRAWKEMQKKQQEFQDSWDREEQGNGGTGEGDDEATIVGKRDLYAEYGFDEETENEKSQRTKGLRDTGELPGQEDEFTMAMMLRTLNVDLDIIGYDKEHQRWSD